MVYFCLHCTSYNRGARFVGRFNTVSPHPHMSVVCPFNYPTRVSPVECVSPVPVFNMQGDNRTHNKTVVVILYRKWLLMILKALLKSWHDLEASCIIVMSPGNNDSIVDADCRQIRRWSRNVARFVHESERSVHELHDSRQYCMRRDTRKWIFGHMWTHCASPQSDQRT